MKHFRNIGAPTHELTRSAAARLVGDLASKSGLFLSHFEYRHHLPIPDDWCPPGRPEFAGNPYWADGEFKEHKYGHFRYDNPIGSFHPAHAAKWTAHELCHALVGFAWQPDASPLFHSITARLSELLPVALWYFFDEADVNRCPQHHGGGPLFGSVCNECKKSAILPSGDVHSARFYAEGRRFVEKELAAIARTRRTGIPYGHRHATLDLNNDALTWTAANRRRLDSDEFRWFRTLFLGPKQGAFSDLDRMEARLLEVMEAILGGQAAEPLEGDRALWVSQDIAWRLLVTSMECAGEPVDRLHNLIVSLSTTPKSETINGVIQQYEAMCEEWILPPPADLFALGYPVGEYGQCLSQIIEGIQVSAPNTTALLGDALGPIVTRFAGEDQPERKPLIRRFAGFLADKAPGATADMARYEAAIMHPEPANATADALSEETAEKHQTWVTCSGVEIMSFDADLPRIIAEIDDLPQELPCRHHHLAMRRATDGDLVIIELSDSAAADLQRGFETDLAHNEWTMDAREFETLHRLGFLTPSRYQLSKIAGSLP
jgi:hypothetical protein